jgi:hypothetical protein
VKPPAKPFLIDAKLFQICGPLLQAFPKIPLAVLWKIRSLQGKKGKFRLPPNFCAAPRSKRRAAERRAFGERQEKA